MQAMRFSPHWRSGTLLCPLILLTFVGVQAALPALPTYSQTQTPAIRVAFVDRGNIWLLGPDGSKRRLTADGHDSAPLWISGGRALLFQRQAGGRIDIMRWQPGTAGTPASIRRLRSGLWSPDGTAVAFVRAVPHTQSAATVWVAQNGRAVRITSVQRGFRWLPAAWSPDGSRLALSRFSTPLATSSASVWVTVGPVQAAHLRRLFMPDMSPGHPGWPDIVFWSPDGRFLTVVVGPNMGCESCRADGRPYDAVPLAGGSPIPLGTALGPDEAVSWAPDGSYLVLSSGPSGRQTYVEKRLVRVTPLTGTRRALVSAGHWSDVEPAVSPNGTQIAFARGRSETSDTRLTPPDLIASRRIYTMDADGTHLHQLTKAAGWTDEAPVWSPDGRWMLFVRWRRHQSGRPAEAALWAVQPDSIGARRLTGLDLPAHFLNGFGYYGAFGWKSLFAVAPGS
ncbi:MAG TPA: hypothetical protein VF898_13955 [Chloroflexota bacterium]